MLGLRAAVCGCIAVLASSAAASPDQAKALFEEGRTLIEAADKVTDPIAKADKVSAACDKFAASLAEDATLGTRLNLADCRTRQGRVVDAYHLYEDSVAEATRTHDRETFAKQQLAAAAGKVVQIALHVVPPEVRGTTIKLAGRDVGHRQWGVLQIAAPGPVVIDATAPDRKPVHIMRDGAAGTTVAIDVAFETIAPVEQPIVHTRSNVPYLVMGGGGVLLATSLGLGLHARSRYSTAKDANDRPGVTSAQHEADLGTVFLAGGAVALGVGIWLYVRDKRTDKPTVTAAATRDSVGLALTGAF